MKQTSPACPSGFLPDRPHNSLQVHSACQSQETHGSRRHCLGILAAWGLSSLLSGCRPAEKDPKSPPELLKIYGKMGRADGRFQKPRAMTIDAQDQVYVVDMTGRIQVFSDQGDFLRLWRVPDIANGKPTGLGVNAEGNILVAHTHYYQVLFYTPDGTLLEDRTIGGVNGQGPGEFGFVTDATQDAEGNYYVSEYGQFDRIQKFDPKGKYIHQWGKHGSEPSEFNRPQSMAFDPEGFLWVSDACNHRLQVFRCFSDRVELEAIYGKSGKAPGEFKYPQGITFDRQGNLLVAEWGNHRLQRLNRQGISLSVWGTPGRKPGELSQPWAVQQDSKGKIHLLDTMNHRVQCLQG